jgi:diguanylate cyclase (GGDEF)-like protein
VPASSVRFVAEFRRRAVVPMVAIMVVAFALAAGLLYQIAREQDRRSIEQSTRSVAAAISDRKKTLAKTLKDYSAWGAAYQNLHAKFDPNWAYEQENVGASLYKSYGYEYVFLLDPKNETIYAVVDGEVSHATFDGTLAGGGAALVARARLAGPNETVVETGVLGSKQDPVLVSAAALSTGGDPTVKFEPGPPSVLIFGERLTPAKLSTAGKELFVSNLRASTDTKGAEHVPNLLLKFVDGRGSAALLWEPDQPGWEMLEAVLPWLAIAAAALVAFVALVFRHAAKAAIIIADSASQLAEAHERAQHQARHDVTTGLPNRLSLRAYLDDALARSDAHLVVMYADLDRFKPVNDALGHAAGDFVLAEAARRLRQSLRDQDIVARVGGDEFVLVAIGMAEHDIEVLCGRLLREVGAPIVVEGAEINIGLSIGIAISPTDATTTDELIRRADLALYQAKSDGRGTYRFFAQEMNERIVLRRSLEADLRRGISQGEFVLNYQPRYATRAMKIVSVEALVRWHHPDRGMISPAEFIPLAEDTGLIVPLGEWVLRTACSAIANLPGIGVSVNVSAAQFRGVELASTVERVLAETGFPPHRLELELTEGVLLEDTQKAQATLISLKALGIKLSMDDFGTGYSSLGYLRNFPFDGIKIDQQFVADLSGTGDARAIVQAIVSLGKALGMTVTAEGVETAEQLLLLRHDACEEVQGYFMSRPISVDALERLIADAAGMPTSATIGDEDHRVSGRPARAKG